MVYFSEILYAVHRALKKWVKMTSPAKSITMKRKLRDHITIGGSGKLSLLLAIVPCVLLIASLSYPTATAVYPECKICKFVAQIFLGGTALSQAITLPYFSDAVHAPAPLPWIVITDVAVPTTCTLKIVSLLGRIVIPVIAGTVVGYRAPPVNS